MNPLDYIDYMENIKWINLYRKHTFEALEEHLTYKQFEELIKKLSDDDGFKFIRCGNFYHESKYNHDKWYIKLIMIFSLIEEINSNEEYIDFKVFCDKESRNIDIKKFKSTKQLLEHLKKKYHLVHGSKQKTLSFFNRYLSSNEKKLLKNSVQIYKSDNQKCCNFKSFKEFVDIIYLMRNNFVHSARFIPFYGDSSSTGSVKKNGKEIQISTNNMSDFQNIFEEAYVRCFRAKIE